MGFKLMDMMDALHSFNPTLAVVAWAAMVGIVVSLCAIVFVNCIKTDVEGMAQSWGLAQDRPWFWALAVSAATLVSCFLFHHHNW